MKNSFNFHFFLRFIRYSYLFLYHPLNNLWILIKGSLREHGFLLKKYAKLKALKNKYRGKRCFIVGTGPSLTFDDLELLTNEISFSMNSIIKIYDKTQWRPTFYGIQDKYVFGCLKENIEKEYANNENIFIADFLLRKCDLSIKNSCSAFPYNCSYNFSKTFFFKFFTKFSNNALKVVYDGYTVTYSLIQIATYLGFSEIYLLGCDCSYKKGAKNHFVESGHIDKNEEYNYQKMIIGYKLAYEECKKRGIKLINATRGGDLDVLPRMKLEDVLKNENK